MKKLSVWPLFAFSSLAVFSASCYMMWLSEHVNRSWDSPSVISFLLSFVLAVLSALARKDSTTLKLSKYTPLRERKRRENQAKRSH